MTLKPLLNTFMFSACLLMPYHGVASEVNVNAPLQVANEFGQLTETLGLNTEQKAHIRDMIVKHQLSPPPIDIKELLEARKKQLDLMVQPEFQEQQLLEMIEAFQAKEKSYLIKEMRLKHQIYNVLDEEQKASFKQLIQNKFSQFN
ncbi:Spy/CpxP family protein refolding chaperone [Vibrio tapetis subsp. quintayensis]|uniref:Spy/CpxP family protein refolding chaperone n=1 Tax=Vibrio tapetis TaxID=52443 RepID=UPI0025B5BED5|nr:Spy/CpxP family protein refolding chaperone [Vibrio tapetis]MDN3683043.1 Spy/CpxP family protein refolding chaperone [Vibrio tapetis subsp. quintayensis]